MIRKFEYGKTKEYSKTVCPCLSSPSWKPYIEAYCCAEDCKYNQLTDYEKQIVDCRYPDTAPRHKESEGK